MTPGPSVNWIEATLDTLASYRRMIDAAVAQLDEGELRDVAHPGTNSVAILLRHLGGNLLSRWTDFLTTDGEKPDRNRDREFEPWDGDRAALTALLDAGWTAMTAAIAALTPQDLARTVTIRGEAHTVPQAILRSLTHVGYHTGQIMHIARTVHAGPWTWLTVPPGESEQHNQRTWGTASSRGVAGS